jgi:hypothetical protein
LFFTLGTTNCSRATSGKQCKFCGLNKLDGEHPPLSVPEAKAQMKAFFEKLPESERSKILKFSLIGMTDSLTNPRTIEPPALIQIAKDVPKFLPNILEASIESRADMVRIPLAQEFFSELSRALGLPDLVKEIASGIEAASEAVRDSMNKGISDRQIGELAKKLAQAGYNFRGYFIYDMLERNDNLGALKRAVDFMADLVTKTKVSASILILRGYIPEGKQDEELFRGFAPLPDKTALADLKAAATYAKEKGVKFEIDSTSEDQGAAGAEVLGKEYTAALARYNLSFNPNKLTLRVK